MQTIDTEIKKNLSIKVGNEIVEARYTLTTNELKLILALVPELNPKESISSANRVIISVPELAKRMKLTDTKHIYRDIKNLTKKLMTRVITFNSTEKNSWYHTHWVQSVECKNGYVNFAFDDVIKRQLMTIGQAYVKAELEPLMDFKSIYANRFYMMFLQYEKLKERTFEVTELKKIFEIEKLYTKSFTDLKRKVIEPAIKEINETTELKIDVEYIKESRGIKYIRFRIKRRKNKETIDIPREEQKTIKVKDLDSKRQELFKELRKMGIALEQAKLLVSESRSIECIEKNMELAIQKYEQGKIKTSLQAYVFSAIMEDYAHIDSKSIFEIEQEEKQKALQEQKLALEKQKLEEEQKRKENLAKEQEENEKAQALFLATTPAQQTEYKALVLGKLKGIQSIMLSKKSIEELANNGEFLRNLKALLKEKGLI